MCVKHVLYLIPSPLFYGFMQISSQKVCKTQIFILHLQRSEKDSLVKMRSVMLHLVV